MTYTVLHSCRACGSSDLDEVLDLGVHALSGVFVKAADEPLIPRAPLALVRCGDCELVQLSVTVAPALMYGSTYGYRSGLNRSMERHLAAIKDQLLLRSPSPRTVLDIGSNDGTLLGMFPKSARRVGFDPTIRKFGDFYQPDIERVPAFFKSDLFYGVADIVTSIAMLYDLPDPAAFFGGVSKSLAPDGVWFSEQSYLPLMVQSGSYDTVCHEHLEYYTVGVLRRLCAGAGLVIVDVQLNRINGGSIAMTVKHAASGAQETPLVGLLMAAEADYNSLDAWALFQARVEDHRFDLIDYLEFEPRGSVFGCGASTKGNTLLQYCGIGPELVSGIYDPNHDKRGTVTPGTRIPIVGQLPTGTGVKTLLVLPWHFRGGFQMESTYYDMLYPLPEIEKVLR